MKLTPEYLIGKWCNTHEIAPEGNVYKYNDIWEFTQDGKVMKQTNSYSTKLKHKSDWKIVDDQLKMKPSHVKNFWNYKSVKVSKDELIIELYDAKEYLHRGICVGKPTAPGLN